MTHRSPRAGGAAVSAVGPVDEEAPPSPRRRNWPPTQARRARGSVSAGGETASPGRRAAFDGDGSPFRPVPEQLFNPHAPLIAPPIQPNDPEPRGKIRHQPPGPLLALGPVVEDVVEDIDRPEVMVSRDRDFPERATASLLRIQRAALPPRLGISLSGISLQIPPELRHQAASPVCKSVR